MANASTPDWRLLAPHRPLGLGEAGYITRPTGGGDAIANWVTAGGNTVLVGGPTGVGKSTELAQAAAALAATRAAFVVSADRLTNVHRLSADELMGVIAQGLVRHARDELRLQVAPELESATKSVPAAAHVATAMFHASRPSAARAALNEITRRSPQGRLVLLIDGLEKLPPGPTAQEIFEALSRLPEEIDLVVVIPWHSVFGGGTESVIRAGERLHRVLPLDTEGPGAAETTTFFYSLLSNRLPGLALPSAMDALVERAIVSSAGLPRGFLQLVADAGTYARVKRGAAWPDASDLDDAIIDQQDSFRRALLPGDTQAIVAVIGSDGRELELERRVRLLAQGVLLERTRSGRVVLEMHPLIKHAIPSRS